LAEALEVIQGVEVVQCPDLNAAPGVQTLRMRGMDANHVLVLINGQRQPGTRPDNQGVSYTDISTISIDNIERIEVLRDGASAQYGSDAVAGVINIVMRKNTPRLAVNSQYGRSSRGDGDEKHLDISSGLPVSEKLFLNMSAFGKKIDHYDRTPDTPRWTSPEVEQAGANLTLSYDISCRQALDVDLRLNQTDTVLRKGRSGDVDQDRTSKKKDQHGGLRWEADFEPAHLEAGASLSLSETEYRHSEDPDYNGDLESGWADAYAHINWDPASWLGLFAGVSHNREDVDSPQRDFVQARDITALFLETRITPFRRLSLQLSGRMEEYSDFGANVAPKLSGRFVLCDTFSLRASLSRSYQVPTLYQLHDRFIGAMGWNDIYGNPDLEPAEGVNTNVGFVWKPFPSRGVSVSVDCYQNRIDNMIETTVVREKTADENAVTSYKNLAGTSTFQGVEVELEVPLAYGFRLDVMGNYLEARNPDGDDLTNRPRTRLNATLGYRLGERFQANLRYTYRGKYLSDETPHKKIEPFDFFSVQATYAVTARMSIYLGVRNLLDEKPPVNPEDYEGGHMESMLDSTLGAFYYGGIRLNF
jgi:outer membrane receptor for ferrienterochelin and colicins